MKCRFFLSFTMLLAFAQSTPAEQIPDDRQTIASFYSVGIGQRTRHVDHPMRLNPFKTICGGRDPEFRSDQAQDEFSSSETRLQTKDLTLTGVHKEFSTHVYEVMSYNVEFTDQDIFRFSFQNNGVNRVDKETSSTDCNMTRRESVVTSASRELSGKVILVVPKNTFALRIQNTKADWGSTNEKEFRTERRLYEEYAQKIAKGEHRVRVAHIGNKALPMRLDEVSYILVRPGDILEFEAKLFSDGLNEVRVDFEWDVAFVGNKDCRRILPSPNRNFSPTRLLSDLKEGLASAQGLDSYIQKASCLRQPDFIRELMLHSSGRSMATFLEEYDKWIDSDPVVERDNIATAISYLTLFDLSDLLLKDLAAYCEETSIKSLLGLPSDFVVRTRGYHMAARRYLKIQYLLEYAKSPHLKVFLSKVSEHERLGYTYAEGLRTAGFLDYAREAQYGIFTKDIRVLGTMAELLDEMPQTRTGERLRSKITSILARAVPLSETVAQNVQDIMQSYSRHSTDKIRVRQITAQWNILSREVATLDRLLRDDLEWFKSLATAEERLLIGDDGIRTEFTRDLNHLNEMVYKSAHTTLRNEALWKRTFFKVNSHDPAGRIDSTEFRTLSRKINHCLTRPTDAL